MSMHNNCRKCGAPSGSFKYCKAHRKENAAKQRAQRAARYQRSRRLRRGSFKFGLPSPSSFPVASEAYYRDQAERRGGEPVCSPAVETAAA